MRHETSLPASATLGPGPETAAQAAAAASSRPKPDELLLEDEVIHGGDAQERVAQLIQQYVCEMKRGIAAEVLPLPEPAAARRMLWGVALGTLLLVSGLFLVFWRQTLALSAAGSKLAAQQRDICILRQLEVMNAIDKYTREHLEPPPDLSSLRPRYLQASPVDPKTGETFEYVRDGNAVWLTCPKHPLPPTSVAGPPIGLVDAAVATGRPATTESPPVLAPE